MAGGYQKTAFILRVQDFYLDEDSVFLSETSVCNNLNAQSIYITINDNNLELSD
jgi:hypothetical protein